MKTKRTVQLFLFLATFLTGANLLSGGELELEEVPKGSPYLGIFIDDISETLTNQLGLQPNVGVVVDKVAPGSPAEEAGLSKHDILIKYDDQWLIGTKQAVVLVRNSEPGSEHTVTLFRKGVEETISVTIGTKGPDVGKANTSSFVPEPPAAPRVPAPVSRSQARALQALANDLKRSLPHGSVSDVISDEEFEVLIELNEEYDEILNEARSAIRVNDGSNIQTIVVHGQENVYEFSDDSGKVYVIKQKGDDKNLTILSDDGEVEYAGALDEDSAKRLPSNIQQGLPKIEKLVSVRAPVWVEKDESGEGL